MANVQLVGPDEGGEHLVVQTEGGERFTLPVTQDLRTVLGPVARPAAADAISPKDIQRRIRAGQTAEEIAAADEMDVERVRRYEGPVLAEREYIAQLARGTRVSREAGSPTLAEAVADRLSRRGVQAKQISWDARRSGSDPWRVSAAYPVAGGTSRAEWTFDAAAHTVRPVDDEARWFTDTDPFADTEPPRHLAAVRADGAADDVALHQLEAPKRRRSTDELLAELHDKRGTREAIEVDQDEDDFEGFGPQQYVRRAQVKFGSGGHEPAHEDDITEADAGQDAPQAAKPAARRRKGRASVPSWDEIVFGAKSE